MAILFFELCSFQALQFIQGFQSSFTTKKTGTGLGLPIVTKIINEHSGNFSIKNRRDKKGSIVTITLPKYA